MSSSKARSQSLLDNLATETLTNTPPKVSTAVKRASADHKKIGNSLFKSSLSSAYNYAIGNPDDEATFLKIQEESDSPSTFLRLYADLIKITTFAVHQASLSVKKETFVNKLKEAGASKDFCESITAVVYNERSKEVTEVQNNLRLPHLADLRWRVYVAISTSVLNRVLEPTVIIELKTSDGKTKTFEVSMTKFHELRYNVTYLLKEMESINKK